MIVIVDTHSANISSLSFALQRLGVDPVISDEENVIRSAERVFLPGVGSAEHVMGELGELGLVEVLKELTQPTLGICLGMQLLMSHSDEGPVDCLDVIPGQVASLDDEQGRLPHMGWNTLTIDTDSPLLSGITGKDFFYFVHSYGVVEGDHGLASCNYAGGFQAVVQKDNFYGVQFHPERSATAGARLLSNFLEIER